MPTASYFLAAEKVYKHADFSSPFEYMMFRTPIDNLNQSIFKNILLIERLYVMKVFS